MHRGGILFESEIDERKLGIYKLQAVFRPMPEMQAFEALKLSSFEIRGSLINLVRGQKEEILATDRRTASHICQNYPVNA